jgi:hypothetical protein
MDLKPIIERAYELAVSGACPGVQELRAILRNEGYGAEVDRHFSSPTLKAALKKICAAAFKAAERAKADVSLGSPIVRAGTHSTNL